VRGWAEAALRGLWGRGAVRDARLAAAIPVRLDATGCPRRPHIPLLPFDPPPPPTPPANVTLGFSFPVDLTLLAAALKLLPAKGGQPLASKLSLLPCETFDIEPRPLPVLKTGGWRRGAGVWGGGARERGWGSACSPQPARGRAPRHLTRAPRRRPISPTGDDAAAAAPAPATQNATCAVVRLAPPLPPGAGAVLRLPKGARYSAAAGPARGDVDIKLFGLRAFRVPFRQDWGVVKAAGDPVYLGAG
jgi:hypothetical protein